MGSNHPLHLQFFSWCVCAYIKNRQPGIVETVVKNWSLVAQEDVLLSPADFSTLGAREGASKYVNVETAKSRMQCLRTSFYPF